jgi:hypothetical protein
VHGKAVRYARKVGTWANTKKSAGASARFVKGAAGDLAIIHGRYATCGDANSLLQAHPFAVQRNGRTALWGAHNGMIEGAHESAAAHGRTCDVDSREAFELLADGNVKDLAQLPGYGTLAWLDGTLRDRVRIVAMTPCAALEICRTACGAIVFASTRAIILDALKFAGIPCDVTWYTVETGKVYEAHADGRLTFSAHADVTLADRWRAPAAWAYDPRHEASTDDFDEFDDPGPCPIATCGSMDTFAYDGNAYCADCDAHWTHVAPDATDDPANEADYFDGESWDRWLESERDRARLGSAAE